MTVTVQTPYNEYSSNGATTVFAFDFKVLRESELKVKVDGLIVTNYSVTGIGDEDGGQITFSTAPAAGAGNVLLYREIPAARSVSYTENGPFPASAVNQDFDNLWLALQSYGARSGGEIRLPLPEQAGDLASKANRYDRVLAFDSVTGLPEMSSFTVT